MNPSMLPVVAKIWIKVPLDYTSTNLLTLKRIRTANSTSLLVYGLQKAVAGIGGWGPKDGVQQLGSAEIGRD